MFHEITGPAAPRDRNRRDGPYPFLCVLVIVLTVLMFVEVATVEDRLTERARVVTVDPPDPYGMTPMGVEVEGRRALTRTTWAAPGPVPRPGEAVRLVHRAGAFGVFSSTRVGRPD